MKLATRILSRLQEEELPPSTPRQMNSGLNKVILGKGDGNFPHLHVAYVDNDLCGDTIEVDGEGEDHDHVIKQGKVMAGGDDNHSHPDISSEK